MATVSHPVASLESAPVPPVTGTAPVSRITSVDLLRGLIMVIMALDHVRDYFTSAPFEPEDLSRTNGALFFTRFITHFCAPTFSLLAGTGAYLAVSRGKSVRKSRDFSGRAVYG